MKEKPTVVAECNQYLLRVDKMDQLLLSERDLEVVEEGFFWTLEVVAVNYISYKE